MFDSILNTFSHMGVDWRLILMNAVNFGIVAVILYYAAFRPVIKMLDERKAKIEAGLRDAEEMKKKLAEAEQKQAEILRAARQGAQEIMDQARAAAKAYQDRESQETAAKVEQMLARGREALELERRKAFDDLRAEVSRLVVATTAKVLSRDLAESEKATLNKHAAEELARNN
jgi:F-type H+-transporting ATPase subunit b